MAKNRGKTRKPGDVDTTGDELARQINSAVNKQRHPVEPHQSTSPAPATPPSMQVSTADTATKTAGAAAAAEIAKKAADRAKASRPGPGMMGRMAERAVATNQLARESAAVPPNPVMDQRITNEQQATASHNATANQLQDRRQQMNSTMSAVTDARDPSTPAPHINQLPPSMSGADYAAISGGARPHYGMRDGMDSLTPDARAQFASDNPDTAAYDPGRAYSQDSLAGRPITPPRWTPSAEDPGQMGIVPTQGYINKLAAEGAAYHYDSETGANPSPEQLARQEDRKRRGREYAESTLERMQQAKQDKRVGRELGVSPAQAEANRVRGEMQNKQMLQAQAQGRREANQARIDGLQQQAGNVSKQYQAQAEALADLDSDSDKYYENFQSLRGSQIELNKERQRIQKEIEAAQRQIQLVGVSNDASQNFRAIRNNPEMARKHLRNQGIKGIDNMSIDDLIAALDEDFNKNAGVPNAAQMVIEQGR